MKRKLLVLLATLAIVANAWCQVGTTFLSNGINFNITSTSPATVEVTSNDPLYSGSITIPATAVYGGISYVVTAIGYKAFYYCSSLTSITIPSSVTAIGDFAFSRCSGLTSITIPPSVTAIGDFAFSRCSGLTSITIPSSVTAIGDWAFEGCSGLTSIIIPSSVTTIRNNTFNSCSGLTSITIPSSVTAIRNYAFNGCSGLTSITIPSSVTSIGEGTFYDCSGLTSITIPSSVTAIGRGAFISCRALSSITAEAMTPVDLSYSLNVFEGVSTSTCELRVPFGSLAAYKAAEQWKDFTNIVEVGVNNDIIVPVITLLGNASIEIAQNSTYIDAGATATDNVDGDISSKIVVTGTVDTKTAGTYTLTYNVTDAAGNKALQVIRTVKVILEDMTAPVITLNGTASVEIAPNSTYTDAGATATDNVDGDISSKIVLTGTVDTKTAGTYTLTYNVTDAAGNKAVTVTRTVKVILKDMTAPVITLKGTASIEIAQDSTYTDAGATASDNVDGNISYKIIVTGSVDTKTIGTYTLTYNVSDAAGNKATPVTRTVKVTDPNPSIPHPSIKEITLTKGDTASLVVTCATTWTASSDQSWLTVTQGNNSLTITAQPNTTGKPRTATITVRSVSGTDSIAVTLKSTAANGVVTITITQPAATTDAAEIASGISFYPVPLKDMLTLSLGGEVASLVQVIDARGVVVIEQIGNISGEIQLNTSALAHGFYTLKVVTASGIVLRQVVK